MPRRAAATPGPAMWRAVALCAAAPPAAAAAAAGAAFYSIGDWGGAALRGTSTYANGTVQKVAAAMAKAAKGAPPELVLSNGDHFYWCGIQNTSDFQVEADWVQPFLSHDALQVPWYTALGNHEYGYNVDANIQLAGKYPHWIADDRYYSKRIAVGGGAAHVTLIVLDTSPCVSKYRSNDNGGWDPCGSEYPTCSLTSGKDNFEGNCMFHQNIVGQECAPQFTWLKKTLASVPDGDWLIVMGHHPIDEVTEADFTSVLQNHGFDLYVNGHTHVLAQYTIDGSGAYITTGAGALLQTADQLQPETAAKLSGGMWSSPAGHTYKSEWSSRTAGFTRHTFSADYASLVTDFVSYEGKVLRSFTVKRGVSPRPPPSTPAPGAPAPGPPAPPGAGCCHYSDGDCTQGAVCCKSKCDDPPSCSYTESGCSGHYGQIHNCKWDGSQCVVGAQ